MATPTPRRFRLTPDRFVIGLLAVECLLFLSERSQWFDFQWNIHWAVLLAVAAVAATILLMLGWFIASLLYRRRFQFSIRSLLVLTVAVAIPCSWLAVNVQQVKRQRQAIAAIEKLGGNVDWRSQSLAPASVRTVFGDGVVAGVHLDNTHVTDADLEHLAEINELESIDLRGTNITDAGMQHLQGLTKLSWLHLGGTAITDTGLKYLKGLPELGWLFLRDTRITDAGLQHVKVLPKLRQLGLQNTAITDTGLQYFTGMTTLERLDLTNTRITDAGMRHLQSRHHLDMLNLSGTAISDTALQYLSRLNALHELGLYRTKVTDEGVGTLREALPKCHVTIFQLVGP